MESVSKKNYTCVIVHLQYCTNIDSSYIAMVQNIFEFSVAGPFDASGSEHEKILYYKAFGLGLSDDESWIFFDTASKMVKLKGGINSITKFIERRCLPLPFINLYYPINKLGELQIRLDPVLSKCKLLPLDLLHSWKNYVYEFYASIC